MANPHDLRELEKDPRLFLYTSLTAGSSHIITATSRLETILKANKIPFQAVDCATDEKARKLWQRRAGKKKLPGLVKDGFVIGDLEEVEEWNEYGELKDNIGPVPAAAGNAAVPAPKLPVKSTATAGTANITPKPLVDRTNIVALPGAAEIAARNNILPKSSPEDAVKPEKMSVAPAEKEKSIERAIKFAGEDKTETKETAIAGLVTGTAVSKEEPAVNAIKQEETVETTSGAGEQESKLPVEPVTETEKQALSSEVTPELPKTTGETSTGQKSTEEGHEAAAPTEKQPDPETSEPAAEQGAEATPASSGVEGVVAPATTTTPEAEAGIAESKPAKTVSQPPKTEAAPTTEADKHEQSESISPLAKLTNEVERATKEIVHKVTGDNDAPKASSTERTSADEAVTTTQEQPAAEAASASKSVED